MVETLPSPNELNYFIEVASTLNMSRAAERLGVSQPALSLAIQRLEGSFGVPLLVRTKSGVNLTPGGRKLVTQARALLHEWERIRSEALKNETEISGRYTMGCHPSVALYALPPFLPGLLRENPLLEVKLVHDLSRKITEEVISFKIDFGVVVNPVEHPDLVIKLLLKDEVSFWVSSARDVNHDVLICDPELLQTQSLLKQLTKKTSVFKRTITSSNLEVITELVAAGAGVGILPSRVATRLKGRALKPFMADAPKFYDRVCLIYRADAQRSKSSRHIAGVIEEKLSS